MKKCKHPHDSLEERMIFTGEKFYYCNKCRSMITGWGYLWRKHWVTAVVCGVIFAVIQTLVHFLF